MCCSRLFERLAGKMKPRTFDIVTGILAAVFLVDVVVFFLK